MRGASTILRDGDERCTLISPPLALLILVLPLPLVRPILFPVSRSAGQQPLVFDMFCSEDLRNSNGSRFSIGGRAANALA